MLAAMLAKLDGGTQERALALPTSSLLSPPTSPTRCAGDSELVTPPLRHRGRWSWAGRAISALAILAVISVIAVSPQLGLVRLSQASRITRLGVSAESPLAPNGTPRAGLFAPSLENDGAGPSLSLLSYLEAHFGPPAKSPYHIWITLADSKWARTGTAALHTFVERLNVDRRAAYGSRRGGVKDTKLVVLALDEQVIDIVAAYANADGVVDRGGYAYGGYLYNKPENLLYVLVGRGQIKGAPAYAVRETVMQLGPNLPASFIEVLPHRDLFFVDSDVFFRYDPYPHMEPYISGPYDLVGSENHAWSHINTGWMWMRKSQAVADAWHEVLEQNKQSLSRDQIRFNEALNTEPRRQWGDGRDQFAEPTRSDFIGRKEIRVHVLDDNLFRAHHFDFDRPFAGRDQSVYLHMTCGDDMPTKLYVAKAQGFWPDLDGYYTSPPQTIAIDRLSGSKEVVTQIMKVLLTAAHYTGRALIPPSHITFLSHLPAAHASRAIYNAFPIPHLAAGLGVQTLDPDYTQNAAAVLNGRDTLGPSRRSKLGASRASRKTATASSAATITARQAEAVVQLADVVEFDMRQAPDLATFLRLLRSDRFASASSIRLIKFDEPTPADQEWRQWQLPSILDSVETCLELHKLPFCDAICRGSKEGHFTFAGQWPQIQDYGTT